MAIHPHWTRSSSAAARHGGLAPAHDEFALPLQLATHAGKAVVGMELGRNFIAHDRDECQAGAFWSRDCYRTVQSLAEINTLWAAGIATATVNVGARKSMGENLNLLASFGRDVSGPGDSRQTAFYLGVQLLHGEPWLRAAPG